MVFDFFRRLSSSVILAILFFLVLDLSTENFASCSADGSEPGVKPKVEFNDPQNRPWFRTPRQREVSDYLYWIGRTRQVLLDVMKGFRDESARFLGARSTKSFFSGNLKCQLPQIEGSALTVGKFIIQHFSSTVERTSAKASARALEDTSKELVCYFDVLKEVLLKNDSENATNQKEYDEFQSVLQKAEASVFVKLVELDIRQNLLEENFSNTAQNSTEHSRSRRGLEVKPISNFSNLTWSDIQSLLATEFSDLQSAFYELVDLKGNLRSANKALSVMDLLITELGELLKLVAASNSTSSSSSSITLTHGPYCNDLTKTGTLMQIFWSMLNDTVSYAIALKKDFDNNTALNEAMDAVTCRASAFSRVLKIISRKMTSSEEMEISDALGDSLSQVGQVRNLLQGRVEGSENALQDTLEQKEEIRQRMAGLVAAQDQLLYSGSAKEEEVQKPNIIVNIKQSIVETKERDGND